MSLSLSLLGPSELSQPGPRYWLPTQLHPALHPLPSLNPLEISGCPRMCVYSMVLGHEQFFDYVLVTVDSQLDYWGASPVDQNGTGAGSYTECVKS